MKKGHFYIWILGAALLHILIFLFLGPGFKFTDDYHYHLAATNWLSQGFFEHQNTFSARLIVFPLAFFLKQFGNNVWAFTLTGLSASLLCIVLIPSFIKQKSVAIIAAYIIALSKLLIVASHNLKPDVLVLAFLLSSIYFFNCYRTHQKDFWKLLVSIGFSFLAILIKLSALPIAVFIFIFYLKFKTNNKHVIGAFSSILIMIILSAIYYHFYFNDPLFRFKIIESGHNTSSISYYNQPLNIILQRILFGPLLLLVSNPLFALFFAFFASITFQLTKKSFSNIWIYLSVATFLFYWFGSTSLSSYNPIPLSPRMWLTPYFFLIPAVLNNLKSINIKISMVILVLIAIIAFFNGKMINGALLLGVAAVVLSIKTTKIKASHILLCTCLPATMQYIINQHNTSYDILRMLEQKNGNHKIPYFISGSFKSKPNFDELAEIQVNDLEKFKIKQGQEAYVIFGDIDFLNFKKRYGNIVRIEEIYRNKYLMAVKVSSAN